MIIWWRLDRAVRSMGDMAELTRWAKRHGKHLVFAEGPGVGSLELDMTSIMSESIIMLPAFAAQMESQAIKERVTSANAALRAAGPRMARILVPTGTNRWPGSPRHSEPRQRTRTVSLAADGRLRGPTRPGTLRRTDAHIVP
ncbi:recombinase family protein [Streptomyces wedmorensis]|uniref:recombinase family protein n=1 Tax=Streptomyces wedmorensis TaxID=43759 RepID=UPI003418E573